MPRKGMRSVFFHSQSTLTKSSPSTPTRKSRLSSPVYTFSERMISDSLIVAEEMINKWNPDTSIYSNVTYLFQENRREAKDFIACIRDLQRAMNYLLFEDSKSDKLVRAQILMQIAMKRMEKEFYHILSTNRDHLDPESISGRSSHASERSKGSEGSRSIVSDYDDGSEDEIQVAGNSISEVEQVSAVAMADIKSIADCMISSGYGKECVKVYKIIRKSIIDEGLYRLGIEQFSSYQIRKMDWAVLELKIKKWLNAANIAVKTLFYGERVLCDHVFSSSDSIRQSCFADISKEEIESIFSSESASVVKSRALASLTQLSDTIRSMVIEFESVINKDSSKSRIHGGSVHPLTRYVMNYLSILSDYNVILWDIFADWPLQIQSPLPESYFDGHGADDNPPSPLSVRFAWLVLVLLCKLDMKVEFYKDVSLSYLFLANNLNFVLTKVRGSNLRYILGEDWMAKHEMKVKQYVSNYEKVGWSKVLSALPEKQIVDISLEEVKSHFKKFNSAFETTYRTQSSWVVPDSKLRDVIEVSVCKNIVPAYTQFYEKYRVLLKHSRNVIKFTPDELTNQISGLFYENSVSVSSSSSSTSSTHGDLSPMSAR
ncbi:hypothetical protein IFM89_016142 [Coptis chinensis]|uniref:Exocyst subunit Exo70 family protein n=1 Tax=Coptis chinensis TaxID=261450 RepID=A0A835HEV7_9MAGN|nr:hypothetical protein IFM89_016142 [Coptis chinensis]